MSDLLRETPFSWSATKTIPNGYPDTMVYVDQISPVLFCVGSKTVFENRQNILFVWVHVDSSAWLLYLILLRGTRHSILEHSLMAYYYVVTWRVPSTEHVTLTFPEQLFVPSYKYITAHLIQIPILWTAMYFTTVSCAFGYVIGTFWPLSYLSL